MQKTRFNQLYQQIMEDITCTSAGVGATNPSSFSGDTYAPGDARLPKIIGIGSKKKKQKIPIMRRSFPTAL